MPFSLATSAGDQATALVHEAYLRLVDPADEKQWDNRGHFFAAAAEAARRKSALKAGGGRERSIWTRR